MENYRKILKWLLACNILFIVVAAGIGYKNETKQETACTTYASKTVQSKVIPVGQTVGIYINTEGILVIDTSEVTDMDGKTKAPAKNKLLSGDYITKLNGEEISTKKQLVEKITHCSGEALIFTINRNKKEVDVKVEPIETAPGEYKVGIWVRDDLQGLGTITYVDGNNFTALGHSITDMDTGERLNVSGGAIYYADIFGIERGEEGNPGEIEGMISYQTENVVGEIADNRLYGIYGTITQEFAEDVECYEAVEICRKENVKKGKAWIQSYVSGEKQQYEIEILNIHKNENGDDEMEIQVTDPSLLSLTGGIIQGMSGSPIIQDGKLVGAVTHVFVDDPTRGYGIFIGSMLEQ